MQSAMTWARHTILLSPRALTRQWGHLTYPRSWRGGMPGTRLPPGCLEGSQGTVLHGYLRRQSPCYPLPPPPVEPWAVPLLTQDMSSRGHGESISTTGAHVLSLLRVQMALPWGVGALCCTPFSGQTPGDVPYMCPLSPELASYHSVTRVGPGSSGQHPHLTRQI